MSPLHLACQFQHKSIVQLLLTEKADPALPGPDGYTPLHIAAQLSSVEITDMLLQWLTPCSRVKLACGK